MTLTLPRCQNRCDQGQPVLPEETPWKFTPEGIYFICPLCEQVQKWGLAEKYIIACQECGRVFPNRWIPPAIKDYVDGDIYWTCDRCE